MAHSLTCLLVLFNSPQYICTNDITHLHLHLPTLILTYTNHCTLFQHSPAPHSPPLSAAIGLALQHDEEEALKQFFQDLQILHSFETSAENLVDCTSITEVIHVPVLAQLYCFCPLFCFWQTSLFWSTCLFSAHIIPPHLLTPLIYPLSHVLLPSHHYLHYLHRLPIMLHKLSSKAFTSCWPPEKPRQRLSQQVYLRASFPSPLYLVIHLVTCPLMYHFIYFLIHLLAYPLIHLLMHTFPAFSHPSPPIPFPPMSFLHRTSLGSIASRGRRSVRRA